jgi:hypothetical protein
MAKCFILNKPMGQGWVGLGGCFPATGNLQAKSGEGGSLGHLGTPRLRRLTKVAERSL